MSTKVESNTEGLEKYVPKQGDKIKVIGIVGKIDDKYRLIVTKVDENIVPIGEPCYTDFEEGELKKMASDAKTFFDEFEKQSEVNKAYV